MSEPVERIVELLARSEAQIALIDRVRPLGLAQEVRRLCAAWRKQRVATPVLRYAAPPDLSRLQRTLANIAAKAQGHYQEGAWLAARAEELLLEASMVSAVGRPRFGELATLRFSLSERSEARRVEDLARLWIAAGASSRDDGEPRIQSDDRSDPRSLLAVVSRRIGELRLPARVIVDSDLMSVAACSDRSVIIRAGTPLTAIAAKRIAEHEVVGHLLPRLSARTRKDVLRCGCAGATDDEEGRALLIEERLGLMEPARLAELGARHWACVYQRRGADFAEGVRGLLELGAPTEIAVRATMRARRGGGLGRELIYLPAMRRLAKAFNASPGLESWFRLGRASLAYALSRKTADAAA